MSTNIICFYGELDKIIIKYPTLNNSSATYIKHIWCVCVWGGGGGVKRYLMRNDPLNAHTDVYSLVRINKYLYSKKCHTPD